MSSYSLEMPPLVEIGPGALARLPVHAARFGMRLFAVTGSQWLVRSGWRARIEKLLERFQLAWFACPSGEPSTDTVAEARRQARGFAPEAIVGIGGGSVLDTAKALSGVIGLDGPVEVYLEGVQGARELPGPGVPWIGVPTTAGTGAEATRNAVLKAATLGVKRSMRSTWLTARAAIIDPELTLELPPAVTGACGLDALTQLVESYVTCRANDFVRSIVRGAFLPLVDALAALGDHPQDLSRRAAASYGAFVSGVALANAGLGAAHGFASGVGGRHDVPHGLLCAVFLPHVLEANAEVIRPQIEELAQGRQGGSDAVQWLAGLVRRLLQAYGLPADLKGFGIPRDSIPDLAERSMGSSMRGNPRELSVEERCRILSAVL